MAATTKVYGKAGVHFDAGNIAWASDTVKLALVTSAYTPDQANHEYFSDITNEITGTGYTAGGFTLAGKSINYDAPTRENQFLASNVSVAALTPSVGFRYGIVYKSTGTAGTSILVAYINFGGDINPAGGPFGIVWAATGVHYDQAS